MKIGKDDEAHPPLPAGPGPALPRGAGRPRGRSPAASPCPIDLYHRLRRPSTMPDGVNVTVWGYGHRAEPGPSRRPAGPTLIVNAGDTSPSSRCTTASPRRPALLFDGV